tara:strand:- start:4 stop:681 length:678 start_codon:yes stop_codon:yes gene_type:complete
MNFSKLLLLCLFTSLSYAQYDVTTVGNDPTSLYTTGMWVIDKGTSNTIEGSYYLSTNWYSKGYLTDNDGKVIPVSGLNYDTKADAFVVKVEIDSIFMFNDLGIKEVHLNNKKFKKFKNIKDIKHSYFEVLAYSNDIKILKHHGKQLVKGIKNPMTQITTPDKLVDVKRVFFINGDKITETKLTKNQFCKFFDSKSNLIRAFISENNISLKDEKYLQQILNYHNTL